MSFDLFEMNFKYSRVACGGDPQELLTESERGWQELERTVFKAQGYRLGGRLASNWTPSWWKDCKLLAFCQSDSGTYTFDCMDAYRITDGSQVAISPFSLEDEPSRAIIPRFLNSIKDPRNHTIPILDFFPHPTDPNRQFIVTPYVRSTMEPGFQLIEEVIDCVEQLLQGLVFMHENRVFHGNISFYTLKMDNDAMYPNGVHPHCDIFCPDGRTWSTRIPRLQAGVKYYYTHFVHSGHIPPELPPVITRQAGEVRCGGPESFWDDEEYNPFEADVFALGSVFKDQFHSLFTDVEFLEPLIDKMMANDLDDRLSAKESYGVWSEIRDNVPRLHRRKYQD